MIYMNSKKCEVYLSQRPVHPEQRKCHCKRQGVKVMSKEEGVEGTKG